ncbi:tetratricopeptide repeat protein [Tautonia plasticadhaerens]|uniref:Cellulose synthase subunit BcsC n=1 Tax=Tautonia plasticadhaerens TaxID=2527974 RepID=A0A518HC53_9BACT|nr:tetratricopeptide repeat protein [Tautonia plasticadhaerens]QDV38419.1 cellulose synthase subunit BcsC [Tautonia plasticadhaerens]
MSQQPGPTGQQAGRRPRWAVIASAVVATVALVTLGASLIGRSAGEEQAGAIASAIASGRLDEADRLASAWLGRRPEDPEALAWASRVALARARPAEAAEFARKAQLEGLDRSELRDVEGIVLARAGRAAEAEPMLRAHLAASDRPEPMVARELAEIGMATFRFGAAREALARWRRDAPDDPEPWVMEGRVAERVGDEFDEIASHYQKALELAPDRDDVRLRLAEILRLGGRHDEAAVEFESYLDRNPEDPEALASAGLNELGRGRFAEAERRLSAALGRDPGHLEALKGLARLRQQTGRFEEALESLDRAAGLEPHDPEIAYQRSLLLARLGRSEEADRMRARSERLRAEADEITRLRDALVRDPNNVDLQHEAARWLIEHDHAEEGIRWAEKALTIRPGHRPTCLLLAEHYEAAGQPDLAGYYRFQADPGP